MHEGAFGINYESNAAVDSRANEHKMGVSTIVALVEKSSSTSEGATLLIWKALFSFSMINGVFKRQGSKKSWNVGISWQCQQQNSRVGNPPRNQLKRYRDQYKAHIEALKSRLGRIVPVLILSIGHYPQSHQEN